MTVIPFDTLAYSQTLQRGGIAREQADVMAQANADALKEIAQTQQLATRQDVEEVRRDLEASIVATRNELAGSIAATRKDLEAVKHELQGSIAATRNDLEASIAATRKDLEASIAATRHDLEIAIARTNTELTNAISKIKQDLIFWIIGSMIGVATLVSGAFAIGISLFK